MGSVSKLAVPPELLNRATANVPSKIRYNIVKVLQKFAVNCKRYIGAVHKLGNPIFGHFLPPPPPFRNLQPATELR
jgi:hypothetical protein